MNKSNWNIYWNEKWNSVADIVRRFCHFLLWRGEFCFDEVGYFELKKITPNCNALAKLIISYLWVSYFTFVFSWQCKTMLFTHKNMQWLHRSVRIALRDINKNGVEIGERQNRCHDDNIGWEYKVASIWCNIPTEGIKWCSMPVGGIKWHHVDTVCQLVG